MHPIPSPDDMQPPTLPGIPMQMTGVPMPGAYQQIGYFSGMPDHLAFNAGKPQKGRRKSAAGVTANIDHVKHRRTRSGCFMCRNRRVKVRPRRCHRYNECIADNDSVMRLDRSVNVRLMVSSSNTAKC